ncbi:MAG: PTS sugar transporter subunit IIC [Clostridiales bacterium]|jgi:uncharacterized membrane protein|nr:PTS sugar transporter subunit IIC [Clostridiales bacterium]
MKVRNYFAEALDGMAKGLFASLIVGVIIKQIGDITGFAPLSQAGQIVQYFMGPCIGAGIALKKKAPIYTVLSAIVVGAIGAGTFQVTNGTATAVSYLPRVGEPAGAFFASLAAVEIGSRAEGKTKFDLLIVPAASILAGGIIGVTVSPFMSELMRQIGVLVNSFTELLPVPMGILLGVVVGMVLTLPISSAALCISIGISGIAAGAALAGCCAQMVGFAVASFRENKVSGLLSQGIGTSMLQVPNIIKNPRIWIAPTISSGICGLLSTTVFRMETTAVGAGMGTAGLVGQFTTYSVMGAPSLIPMLILHFLIPAALTLIISEFLRKISWVKPDDMKL